MNIFEDLKLPDAEELNAKTRIAYRICGILEERKLTQPRLRQFSGSFSKKTELSLGFLGSKILVRAICSAKF